MDSREPQPPPPAPPSQQQHHQHQQQQHSMMLGPASSNSYLQNPPPSMITPGGIHPAAGGFPFNSAKPSAMDGVSFDGSSPPSSAGMRFGGGGGGGGGGGLSVDQGKKKRGRPRKYTPDGNIALGLSPTPISSSGNSIGLGDPSSAAAAAAAGSATPGVASEPAPKKNRGRPPGSGKKQLDALGGVGGIGFTPHVITVKAGEDIASKIMAFSQQGPRTVCILSANGAICNVTLRQPATSGGTVTYEGRYEIISLSGSFLLSENNGSRSRTGGLSVSLAGSDGRVLGGGVAGMLMAASPVQVIVGSFIADGKKSHSNLSKSGPSSAPPTQMLTFGAATTASPPSHGGSTESSDENGSSPLNRGPGIYGNSGQHMHNMQMYQLWAGQNPH